MKSNFFSNLKIRNKLAIGFSINILFIIILAVSGMSNLKSINNQIKIYDKVTDMQVSIADASIEQVRFQWKSDSATSDLVFSNLADASTTLSSAKEMMKSPENIERADKILSAIEAYEQLFKQYTESNTLKVSEGEIRQAAEQTALASIRETLVLEHKYIDSLTDSTELLNTFEIYNQLKDILDSFMETRVAVNKYLQNPTDETAATAQELIDKSLEAIDISEKSIKDPNILSELANSKENVLAYEKAFANYKAVVDEQLTLAAQVREDAVLISTIGSELELGVLQYVDDLRAKTNILNIGLLVGAVLLSLLIAYVITVSITKPMKKIVEIADNISSYNLKNTVPQKLLEQKDELGHLATAINIVNTNILDIVKTIFDRSEQVASSSEELSATSEVAATTSQDIAKTIEEIAEGATDQAKNTEIGAANVNELGALIESEKHHVEQLSDLAHTVDALKDEGLSVVRNLVNETQKSNEASVTVYGIVEDTNISAEKIENASQMIQNIATQTNLLALNAAIEAARAGEAGRGFSVVADEIRKLAEQSSTFTIEIQDSIRDLIVKSTQAVETMKSSQIIAQKQANSVTLTSEKFDGISKSVDEMKNRIDELITSSQIMESKKNQIIDVIENLSAISEENAAGSEEAAAAIEEQTSSMDEISNASNELAKIAEELRMTVSKFTI